MLALLDASCQEIPEYVDEFRRIEAATAAVEARHPGALTLRVADDFPASIAAYTQFDVLLVNAVMDGLNLVAKEAPVVNERAGAVVLSVKRRCIRGARSYAVPVDPFDVDGMAAALEDALSSVRGAAGSPGGDPGARAQPRSRGVDRRAAGRPRPGEAAFAAHERPLACRPDRAVRMVDVGGKPLSRRRAVARASVRMAPETAGRLGALPKGDALTTAQLAGIMAAKRTSDLIPLCHPLPLSVVEVALEVQADGVEITATAETTAQTGVEMEALKGGGVDRGPHGLRHGEGDRQGDGDHRGDARREVEGRAVKGAVLTVSDGVANGSREDAERGALAEPFAGDGYEVERRVVLDEAGEIATAITELAGDGGRRAHDRRHRRRAARRHA